jgi:hypothetical protein
MNRTSAADLLARAERLTRQLSSTSDQIDKARWDQFDVTLHRALYELVEAGRTKYHHGSRTSSQLRHTLWAYPAPLNIPMDHLYSVEHAAALLDVSRHQVEREIRNGNLQLVPGGEPRLLTGETLQRGRRIAPAQASDPHALARLSTTLGAFADLLSQNNRSTHAMALGDALAADTVRRVLSVGAVAARHVVAHSALEAVDRPLRIARYASAHVDRLDPSSRRAVPLELVTAILPVGPAASIDDRLQSALHTWERAARLEVQRLVASTEALASIASQGVRLYAITHQLLDSAAGEQHASEFDGARGQLRQGGATLRDAERALRGISSLAAPSHDYVTAARELFTTLQEIREMAAAHDAGLDPAATLASLAHGCTVHSQVLTAARGVPASLLHCRLLFAPARDLQPTIARLNARSKRRFVPLDLSDAPELRWRWDLAAATAPAVSAALQQLVAEREVSRHDTSIEMGPAPW